MRVGHPQAYITKNRIILLIRFFFTWNLGIKIVKMVVNEKFLSPNPYLESGYRVLELAC